MAFPFCPSCERFHWYPLPNCPHCRDAGWAWRAVSGGGSLYSWTVVRRAFAPEFSARLPYVVGLITFPDAPGIRFVANVGVDDLPNLSIGASVQPEFEPASDGTYRFGGFRTS